MLSEYNENMIFTRKDDFIQIISFNNIIKNRPFNIELDTHGKSSFIYFVKCDNEEYVFKFPRTLFQLRLLNYEYQILNQIKVKLRNGISNYNIYYDLDNRPYVVYSKIDGYNMADMVFNDKDYEKISYSLAKEIFKLHSLKIDDLNGIKLYTKKELLDMFCSEFNYTPEYNLIGDILDDDKLIHGDYHRHNILVNEKKEFVAILDFSTFSKGSIYFDLGHMILSVKSLFFKEQLIKNYEKISKENLDRDKLDRVIKFIRIMINENYLPYINAKDNL